MKSILNSYTNEPDAIERDVMNYVNMIIGTDVKNLCRGKIWTYRDPRTGKLVSLKIDESFINCIEKRMGLKTHSQKLSSRTTITKIYAQRIVKYPNYHFIYNSELVKAVTDVRLKSDIAGAGSLAGAFSNPTNEEKSKTI